MLKPLQEYKCNTYENDHYTAYERGYGDGLSDGEDWGNRVVDLLDAALNTASLFVRVDKAMLLINEIKSFR